MVDILFRNKNIKLEKRNLISIIIHYFTTDLYWSRTDFCIPLNSSTYISSKNRMFLLDVGAFLVKLKCFYWIKLNMTWIYVITISKTNAGKIMVFFIQYSRWIFKIWLKYKIHCFFIPFRIKFYDFCLEAIPAYSFLLTFKFDHLKFVQI